MILVQKEPSKIYYGAEVQVSDMKGPCESGFHVPTDTELNALLLTWTNSGGTPSNYSGFSSTFKIPQIGGRGYDGSLRSNDYGVYLHSCVHSNQQNLNKYLNCGPGWFQVMESYISNAFPIRPFKDTPVIPNSSWTTLINNYAYMKQGLISFSPDGNTWYTMSDKNLGATDVWNSGDSYTEAKCGKLYQRGNNYGFSLNGSEGTSSTQVNASTYGPGNYYEGSTFITYYWDSSNNANLRGGTTQGTYPGPAREVKAVFLGEDKVRPTTPVFEPVWDYYWDSTNYDSYSRDRSNYWGLGFTPKVNCTLDKVKFVADLSGIGTLYIWSNNQALYTDSLTGTNTAGGEYTLTTPLQLTAGTTYIVGINIGYQYYKQANGTLTGTNVNFNGYSLNQSVQATNYIINVRGVETTQTA